MRQCFGDYPQDHNVVCGRVFPCCFGPCIFQFPTRKVINKGNAQKRTPVAWMNSLIGAMAKTKTNLWGCKQRKQMFLLIACSHGIQGHFLPWIVNTNVSTCITVQNLACLDCFHLFVAVAILFPLITPSDCNKCAEWPVTDDATNPTRKFPNPFGIGSSDDMGVPNNKLSQRTVDSASETTWKIGPILWGDSQTCKEVWATSLPKNGWRLPLCSCSCSVVINVMLAIDLKNHAL